MADNFLGQSIKAGATSQSVRLRLLATADGSPETGKVAADMTCSYWRQGGTRTAITPANLAAVNSAYSSGGVKEVDGTNMAGEYRLDVPDAAIATGAEWVVFFIKTATANAVAQYSLHTHATLARAVWSEVLEAEGSLTAQKIMSALVAFAAGVTDEGGVLFKDPSGAATRIDMTINDDNERTAVAVTPSAY